MTILQALLLGIIQGLTEFFPVSSSGHLQLFQYFFGLENLQNYIVFDLICHLGTLCAILLIYRKKISALFFGETARLKQIVIATLPLFPIVFILKKVEDLFDKPQYLGPFFLATAAILYAGIRLGTEKKSSEIKKHKNGDALKIGLLQTVALLPGISRSGITITGARLLGWSTQEAVTFSFLLAIPAILGGVCLKTLQLAIRLEKHPEFLHISHYLAGFISSFLVGSGTLIALIRLASKEKFMYFVWYCLLLGLAVSITFLISKG